MYRFVTATAAITKYVGPDVLIREGERNSPEFRGTSAETPGFARLGRWDTCPYVCQERYLATR